RLFFMSVLVVDGLYSFTWYGSAGAGQQVDTRLVASIKMIAKINITASRTLAARVLTASDGS
ncbi:hypothetical protein, partial [Xanthomonas campestris]|uniref:hypothetical protein n=2 Tax=Xanthomonas campestris TaxID=339 RepID=UPI0025A3056E